MIYFHVFPVLKLLLRKTCLIVSLVVAVVALCSYQGSKTSLTVHFTNLEQSSGAILIGLYNSADDFPKRERQFVKRWEKVNSSTLTVEYFDLPEGDYAIAAYHDLDSDKKCNTNFIGYPTEPFCFSNDVRPMLSAPSFDSAKFSVTGGEVIYIKMQ
ncbi:DUF2141 domain-containing protein [Chitinophagales bacterium]|nr:DUF2141 domain-containing protein [Chitinophagales bacterium]